MSENATNQTKAPGKFVMQHVWKTGGTELCRLARANGWKVPETPGCTIFIHPHQGWPEEDYDMYGNEGAIPSGVVDNEFFPRNEFATKNHNWKTAHGVKWITTLRHPYARTLSHYNHVKLQAKFQNLTFEEFLVERGGGFEHFIDNQQTRWHCGTGHCANTKFQVNEEKLSHAISNLDKMSAVLLLEGMKDPTSCTRRQMRHVLQFKNETLDGQAEPDLTPKTRHSSKTDWEQVVRPFLDNRGISTNSSVNGFNTSVIMSALGFHNSYDMQLYGYARHLCEVLADQYDQEANTTLHQQSTNAFSVSVESTIHHNGTTSRVVRMAPTADINALPTVVVVDHLFVVMNVILLVFFVVVHRRARGGNGRGYFGCTPTSSPRT